jgi:hypothetical protein
MSELVRRFSGRNADSGSFVWWSSTTGSGADAVGSRPRRRPLGSGDAIHAEHSLVSSQVAPGGEVGPVGSDHEVLRLDLAFGLDAADVDVADVQHVVVAHGSPDGLGDLGVGVGSGLDEKPDLPGGGARLLQGPFGHGSHDLLAGAPGVTREQHVLAAAQGHGDGGSLARREVERRQAHRAVERVPPVRPCFDASGTPDCPNALRSRSMVLTLSSKCAAS